MTRLLFASALCILVSTMAVQAQSPDPQAQSLQRLHDALKLRPEQETGWQAFRDANVISPQQAGKRRDAMQTLPGLTAPQRVDLTITWMKDDLDTAQHRGEALKAFYAALSPAQQALFNQATMPGSQ